jgi:hypothetical protein
MTAGFQLMQFNLMVRLAPAQLRPAHVAVFLAEQPSPRPAWILGGQAPKYLPLHIGDLFGVPMQSFHLLFVFSKPQASWLVTNLVQQVREPAEQPVVAVWREMKTMRTLIPC